MPRTPKSKSPDRALPPLNGGDSREDFYPPGARSRLLVSCGGTPGGSGKLSKEEFAAADPWRIVSRVRDRFTFQSPITAPFFHHVWSCFGLMLLVKFSQDNAKAQGNGTSHRGGVDRANRLLGASTSVFNGRTLIYHSRILICYRES